MQCQQAPSGEFVSSKLVSGQLVKYKPFMDVSEGCGLKYDILRALGYQISSQAVRPSDTQYSLTAFRWLKWSRQGVEDTDMPASGSIRPEVGMSGPTEAYPT